MKNACVGVLYPQSAASQIDLSKTSSEPTKIYLKSNLIAYEVPHKAWLYCKEELENTFSYLKEQNPANIFVLAPLHKGPIDFDSPYKIYSPLDGFLKGQDWQIELEIPKEIKALSFVEQNDDVCTEEHSLEVLAPFIAKVFPNAKVCYLLAPAQEPSAQEPSAQEPSAQDLEEICEITAIIGRLYSDSLIFISNNNQTNCAAMWMRENQ